MAIVIFVMLGVGLPEHRTSLALLAGAGAAFALGLLDDFRHLAPSTKLVGQVMVASTLVLGGVRLGTDELAPVAFLLTVFWIVAMMNALNLIDNMDGLAAGITVIAGVVLGLSVRDVNPSATFVAAATAGTALGFLVHNFHPARIFMGDAGSQLLGFLLGAAAIFPVAGAGIGPTFVGPLAVLAVPLFDMALVIASRQMAGRSITEGGRDHTSHRLAALGLSDRTAVLLLYGVTVVIAGVGLLFSASIATLPVLILVLVGLVLFGVFLGEVDVYGWQAIARQSAGDRPRGRIIRDFITYARFGAEVGLDVALLTLAYYMSYLIRFEAFPEDVWLGMFVQSVPVVVGAQLATLVVLRIYRTLWRYLGISDAVAIVRALTVGVGLAALAILLLYRFEGYSRAVFVLDWLLACALLIGARAFLLWLRHWFATRPRAGAKKVLIIGATDAGALAIRLLTRSKADPYRIVGFVDDDPAKRFRHISGIPIVGTSNELPGLIDRLRPDLMVIALDERDEVIGRVQAICAEHQIECRQLPVPA